MACISKQLKQLHEQQEQAAADSNCASRTMQEQMEALRAEAEISNTHATLALEDLRVEKRRVLELQAALKRTQAECAGAKHSQQAAETQSAELELQIAVVKDVLAVCDQTNSQLGQEVGELRKEREVAKAQEEQRATEDQPEAATGEWRKLCAALIGVIAQTKQKADFLTVILERQMNGLRTDLAEAREQKAAAAHCIVGLLGQMQRERARFAGAEKHQAELLAQALTTAQQKDAENLAIKQAVEQSTPKVLETVAGFRDEREAARAEKAAALAERDGALARARDLAVQLSQLNQHYLSALVARNAAVSKLQAQEVQRMERASIG